MVAPTLLARVALAATTLGTGPSRPGAAGADAADDPVEVRVWTTRDGLPSDTVTALAEDADGYLWIGTDAGLARFDGARLTRPDSAGPPSLIDERVTHIERAIGGGVLVTAEGGPGLLRFTPRSTVGVPVETGDNHFARDVVQETADVMWLATGVGLSRLERGRASLVGRDEGLPASSVRALARGPDGRLWVGTTDGLAVRSDGRFQPVRDPALPAGMVARALVAESDGSVWVGTARHGLLRWDGQRWTSLGAGDGLSDPRVFAVLRTRAGALWVGTAAGLDRFDAAAGARRVAHVGPGEGLASPHVLALAEDRDGSLWVGTDRGLHRLSRRPFRLYDAARGLPDGPVMNLAEAPDGSVLVSVADQGIYRLAPGAGRIATRVADFAPVIATDRDGALVTGGPDGEIVISRSDGRARLGLLPRLTELLGDRTGRLWAISLSDGVLSGGRDGALTAVPGADEPSVVTEGHSGTVWLGYGDGRVGRLRPDGVQPIAWPPGAHPAGVAAIHEDPRGALWLAEDRRGLWRFADGRLTLLDRRHGLPSERITSILEDDDGRLWMQSKGAVFQVARSALEEVAAGASSSVSPIVHGSGQGLVLSSRQMPGARALRARDGTLWFPIGRGVAVFDPRRPMTPLVPPRVLLEEATFDGQALPIDRPARFGASRGNLDLRYTATSLSQPASVHFGYRLEGYDPSWVDAGPRRTAQYTGLPAGEYRFRVRARVGGGPWTEAEETFSLSVARPFYRRRWFLGSCAAMLIAAAIAVHRARLLRARDRFQVLLAERSRVAREMHDTLAQSFVGISVQIEAARAALSTAPELAAQDLARAGELARAGLGEARRSVWALRPGALEAHDLATALRATAASLSGAVPVELSVSGAARRLAAPLEDNLLRIGQEAMTNAVRHAAATRVDVALAFHATGLVMTVHDDGRGFDAGSQAAGHGLVGMRQRADVIGGELSIRSSPQGTEIRVEVRG